MLTAAEKTALRTDAAVALLDTATIRRKTGTTWADVATGVACRLRLVGRGRDDRRSEVAADVGANALLTVPAGTDLRRLDRVTVSGRVFEALMIEPDEMVHRQALGRVEA